MREVKVEEYLKKCVEALGGEIRKVKWIGRRHAPDRVVMFPIEVRQRLQLRRTKASTLVDGVVIWVEVKAPGEKSRPGQLREHERMRRAGQWVEVVDSFESVDRLLKR
jgi:hypothetical protein